MAMTTVSKALPSREVIEDRVEAARLKIWQVEGTCGLASTAGWGESGGSAGFAHNIWTSMAGAARALDAVAGLLDPSVLLDTAETDPETGEVIHAAMPADEEGALAIAIAMAEKLHGDIETTMGFVNQQITTAGDGRPASERAQEIADAFGNLRDASQFISQALDLLRESTPKERAEIRELFGQEVQA
jgi:hypothetical protein